MQYTKIFSPGKHLKFHWKNFDISDSFVQNIDCGYPQSMSAHNLCFGSKIRKIGIPLHNPVFLYKKGVQGGILFTDMFFSDEVRV